MISKRIGRKGFTLIELLAVIVILAIVLVITVPGISGIIKSSTKSSMESDAKMLLKAVDLKKLGTDAFDPVDYNANLEGLLTTLKLSGDNYESIVFTNNGNKLLVTIEGKGKWAGLTACGSYQNMSVSEDGCALDLIPPVISFKGGNPLKLDLGDDYIDPGVIVTDNSGESIEATVVSTVDNNTIGDYTVTYTATDSSGNTTVVIRIVNVVISYAGPGYKDEKGVNGPVLAAGMIPVKWVTDHWVTTTKFDSDWYQYGTTSGTRNWANVIQVSNPSSYVEPGTTVNVADDVIAFWVWIPRYAYQIATCYHLNAADCFTETGNNAGTINVKFLKNTTDTASDDSVVATTPTYSADTQSNYITHPAFWWDSDNDKTRDINENLTGFWVAKFEASGTTGALNFKPGVESLKWTTAADMFTASRNMEQTDRYGWVQENGTLNTDGTFTTSDNNVDTHMMKNTEWGAVAYLAQSIYGKNAEIWINNSKTSTTGCAGDSVSDAKSTTGCEYAYTTDNGLQASTTGNIYGIYDMSGGAREIVMGNYREIASDSGLTPSSIHNKYIDIYPTTGAGYTSNIYGDAVYETSGNKINTNSWYSDRTAMITSDAPWFRRGEYYIDQTSAGVFSFISFTGGADSHTSWRVVVLVGAGL